MNNFKTEQLFITGANQVLEVNLAGQFSCTVTEVTGSYSAGNVQIQGGISTRLFKTLFTEDMSTGGQLASNEIITAGLYRCAPAGIETIRITSSNDFSGSFVIVVSCSEGIPPQAVIGL